MERFTSVTHGGGNAVDDGFEYVVDPDPVLRTDLQDFGFLDSEQVVDLHDDSVHFGPGKVDLVDYR